MKKGWKTFKDFFSSGHAGDTAGDHFDSQNDWKHASNKTKSDVLGKIANGFDAVASGCTVMGIGPCALGASIASQSASSGSIYYDYQEYGNINETALMGSLVGAGFMGAGMKFGNALSGYVGVGLDSAGNVFDFLFDSASTRR